MKYIDFHFVPDGQKAMDSRLNNWGLSVRDSRSWSVHPMWRYHRSPAAVKRENDVRIPVDQKDAITLAKLIRQLPLKHWQVVCWFYVTNEHPGRARKRIGLSEQRLFDLLQDARQMLVNFAGVKNK